MIGKWKGLVSPKLVFLVIGIALFTSCGSDADSSKSSSAGHGGPASIQGDQSGGAQAVDVTKVISKQLSLTIKLPGEVTPYESVVEYPKVTAFVKWIGVDRGSHVKAGQEIVRLEAPELVAQKQEAQSKLQAAEAQRAEADAKLTADQSTFARLKSAAATPGVVAGNDLEVAQQMTEADRARVRAADQNIAAAKSAVKAVAEIESYLQVRAPFDGVVTERNVHPGALVGPSGTMPMLRIEKVSRLRVVVPVPETYFSGTVHGSKVNFTVPAFPGEKFTGTIARIPDSLDVKTRTMPVELDVMNPSGRLAPGMYPEVVWPVRRSRSTLFVPTSAIARTNERQFLVTIRGGKAEWIDVQTGAAVDKMTEVFGDLHEGEMVVVRGTDELRPGTSVSVRKDAN